MQTAIKPPAQNHHESVAPFTAQRNTRLDWRFTQLQMLLTVNLNQSEPVSGRIAKSDRRSFGSNYVYHDSSGGKFHKGRLQTEDLKGNTCLEISKTS